MANIIFNFFIGFKYIFLVNICKIFFHRIIFSKQICTSSHLKLLTILNFSKVKNGVTFLGVRSSLSKLIFKKEKEILHDI